MTIPLKVLSLSLFFFSAGSLAREDGILVVQVEGVDHRPLTGVRLAVAGDNTTGPPTDVTGRTRIRLAQQTRPKTWAKLILVGGPPGRDLVFLSPYNALALIPPFENEAQNYVEVVLAERGQRRLLEDPAALRALTERTLDASVTEDRTSGLNRQTGSIDKAIQIVAHSFGLTPSALDSAVKSWASRTSDPYDRGIAALYLGRPEDATTALSASLAQSDPGKRTKGDNGFSAAFFLGGALLQQGLPRDAIPILTKAVSLQPENAEALGMLAYALTQQGNLSEAEPVLRKSIRTLERADGGDSWPTAMAYGELGTLLRRKGDLPGAETAIRHALEIAGKHSDSTEMAPILADLGSVLSDRGDYINADVAFTRALSLAERAPAPNHFPFLVMVLREYGAHQRSQGLIVDADSLLARALVIERKLLPPDHSDIALTAGELGVVRAQQGKLNQADSLFRASIASLERTFGPEHPAVGYELENLATLLTVQNDLSQAEALARRALVIDQKALGPQHPQIANALMTLAFVRMKANDVGEAKKLVSQAITMYSDTLGPDHPATKQAMKALAELH